MLFDTRTAGADTRDVPVEGYLTTNEAAARLKISRSRVLALIRHGQLEAKRFGSAWMIHEDALREFQSTRRTKAGRPREKRQYTRRGD